MKAIRCFTIILFFVISSTFVGCNSIPNDVSDEHYQYGIKAVEIIDSYLDYDIDADAAYNRIEDLMGRADTLPDEEISSATCVKDTCIECEVSFVSSTLSRLKWNPSNDDFEKLKEYRNNLADFLKLKNR